MAYFRGASRCLLLSVCSVLVAFHLSCAQSSDDADRQGVHGSIRLVGGGSSEEGRVEIYLNGTWGTICDDGWTIEEADVVCHELGFGPAAAAPPRAHFGEGALPILLDDIRCTGDEQVLLQCQYSRVHNCQHSEDASVICTQVGGGAIRLENGMNHNEGNVEVHRGGQWGSECGNSWDMGTAEVACRQLGFRGALRFRNPSHLGPGRLPVWRDDISCFGNERRLSDCGYTPSPSCNPDGYHNVAVTCDGPDEGNVRLLGGRSASEGRIEIFVDGEWGSVCGSGWALPAAQVVCRQLGFADALTAATNATTYGRAQDPIQMSDVACLGNETSLLDCPHTPRDKTFCSHEQDAGVACREDVSEVGTVRLADGDGILSGRVEIYLDGDWATGWATVCDESWGIEEANVVCRQLGFVAAVYAYGSGHFNRGAGGILEDYLECTGSEGSLIDCVHPTRSHLFCSHYEDAGVLCTNDTVLPRFRADLRCGRNYLITGRPAECDPEGPSPCCSPFQVECGYTADVCECADCFDYRDGASLIRLAGRNRTAGRVEVHSYGEWRSVCDDGWGMEEANVTCRQLGYRGAVSALVGADLGESGGTTQSEGFECSGDEERLVYCPPLVSPSPNCSHAGVVCYASPEENRGIRLANGNDTAGRVEVFYRGVWGTVCDDHWDIIDARVACRQLGFDGATVAVTRAHFGPGEGPTFLDDVKCSGSEERLDDCPHVDSSAENCGHNEDAGVVCYTSTEELGAIRLVNGNRTAGRVEIYLDGQWGTICDDRWGLEDADVVCRQLGFSGALSALGSAYFGEGFGWTQMDDVDCLGEEERLVDCAHVNSRDEDCGHYEDAGAVCVVRGDA